MDRAGIALRQESPAPPPQHAMRGQVSRRREKYEDVAGEIDAPVANFDTRAIAELRAHAGAAHRYEHRLVACELTKCVKRGGVHGMSMGQVFAETIARRLMFDKLPVMPGPVRAADVVVGLLTENAPRMLTQAIRLLRSIRWSGGELTQARIVVCGVGPLEAAARSTIETLGAEVRIVTRFHPANPTGNRHQLIAELLTLPQEVLFLLDCDTLVVRDPLPYLDGSVFQGKITPTPTVSDEVFERLFAHFNLVKPARAHITSFSGTPTIPYFNSGVLVVPTALARRLAPVWRRYNEILAEQPDLAAPCERHMLQASLSLALVETGVPYRELPAEMNFQVNFQVNAPHLKPPPGFVETDPVIIHYHQLATDDGFLLPCPYPRAQARIERFHERLRAEGFAPAERQSDPQSSRPLVILGMHRSGTSLVAELINAFGVYAGQPDELPPPDMFNPTGFWEHNEAVRIDQDILAELGGSWCDVAGVDVSLLSDPARAGFLKRIRKVAGSLQQHAPFLLKDPRMSILFGIWREGLTNPICIIVWRDPLAVARSVAHRDGRPFVLSLALWEHYNRTLLRESAGLHRLLVSYDELLADPTAVVDRLHEELASAGVNGLLAVPGEERIRQLVNADFNRSGAGSDADRLLLNGEQTALLDSFRNGAVLDGPVSPASTATLSLLAAFGALETKVKTLERSIDEDKQLLNAVFESRSWRVGNTLSNLLKRLRRRTDVSAEERWAAMGSESKGERTEK
jgi:hypothetical protein